MKTSQQLVGTAWHEDLCCQTWIEPQPVDTIHDAETRATLVFDMLLTYLSSPAPGGLTFDGTFKV
ncbi:MAG: hypothetical protein JSS49_29385 [Planctomycetes bacterium]|nr:hypothetical protein [Planctomycetota bacterium]